jgi:hypothetical protein
MSGITIFTAPKPFLDPHIKLIQRNAIKSWMNLDSMVEVLLIGDEVGLEETAQDLGLKHLGEVEKNNLDTPLVSSIFNLAHENASYDLLMYLNADIILLPETIQVIQQVQNLKEEFLLSGRRWDLDINQELEFGSGWVDELKRRVRANGRLRTYTAMDYFIFPRQLYQNILDFAIGRAGWDNWMIYHGLQQDWPVIDLTPSLVVIHQNHDYHHLPGGALHYDLEESHRNVLLSGGMRTLYDLLDVQLVFKNGRIQNKKPSLESVLRRLERWVIPDQQSGWRWTLTRMLRKTRKRIFSRETK